MNQKIDSSELESFTGVEYANFSHNEKRLVVVGEGMLQDTTKFLLNHGYAVAEVRQHGDQLKIDFREITDF